ncbi:hypothetical protein [Variovorax sp. JS1663]|uniref:hypothetical protein n=1 Tax=Variovorax sp. JS1663 TaxID=1851577 RepID=UPI000B341286|nr:hypothetical protein [Variovorax sp. JS1663]OUL99324.1 hypothetical protein A8M77_27200 [Variovorax sp. JS1663]
MKKLISVALLGLCCLMAPAIAVAQGGDAAALRAKFNEVRRQFEHNLLDGRMVLESAEMPDQLRGDAHAVIAHPFLEVSNALRVPAVWCEILMLHLNTKHCLVQETSARTSLVVAIGRTYDQPLSDAQRIDLAWRTVSIAPDYLAVRLSATHGPLATRDYRIELKATPIDDGKTFIHLGYAYSDGIVARLAMQIYLATTGSGKIGFTVTGTNSAGEREYVGGVRGVVERNTMRYYLAIEAYLDAPEDQQLSERLSKWFDGTARYARQLHEMDRSAYIAMKQEEFQRMRVAR